MDSPCFLTDIYIPQMLYALTIRSPVAKGRLTSIECPKLPGSYTLIRAGDIPGKNSMDDSGLPVLAGDTLSYIGEPVALLLGPDKNTLEDYLQQCTVIAEAEEPVFDINPENTGMIAARRDLCIGDPDAAFAQAASIIRGSYTSGIQEHWYAEPSGAVSWLEPDETEQKKTLIVRTATQWPFHVRRSIAKVLGLNPRTVVVRPTITGLHMDGKLWYPSLISCHAALGAWLTNKPVRLTLARKEDFFFSPKRCAAQISIASALDDKGAVTGIDINAAVNLGAHGVNAAEVLDHVNLGGMGVYNIRNIRFSGIAVTTNIPPQGPFAGFGLAQGSFALERHVSCIADSLNQDPAQWRKNAVSKTIMLPIGLPLKDQVPVGLLIDTTAKMSDYRRKWTSYELLRRSRKERWNAAQRAYNDSVPAAWIEKGETLRGIGIAMGYQANGLLRTGHDRGNYTVELVLEKDGSLEIKTSMANSSAGCGSVWVGIASEILSVDAGLIRVSCDGDCPDSGPATLSRAAGIIARLVGQACLAIRKKRFRDPLPISVRKSVSPLKNSAGDDCFSQHKNVFDYSGFIRPGWASAVVEIEIDPVDYLPRIRGVWMGIDGGKILSEDRARRTLKTSAVQALGWAYREQISYVNGAITVEQFENFDIPGPQEIPPVTIDFIANSSADPKGIGDLPFNCIPAAYMQAVSQAMDFRFQSIPLKALDIWEADTRTGEKPA